MEQMSMGSSQRKDQPMAAPEKVELGRGLAIGAVLYRAWVKAGKPRGIRNVAAEAEETTE